MTDPGLVIGCHGWDHDSWVPDFYPEELPRQWRLCFYSNAYRGVLVPAETVAQLDSPRVRSWREDCDAEFRFVFEVAPAALAGHPRQAWQRLWRLLGPLQELTAGFLLENCDAAICSAAAAECERPLWVDSPPGQGPLPPLGRVWRPADGPIPTAAAGPLLALVDEMPLPALRALLPVLQRCVRQGNGAGLFFCAPRQAPTLARQARILAELLEIA